MRMNACGPLLVMVWVSHATSVFAKPSCDDQLATYGAWLAPIKADIAQGAVMSDRVELLVAIPLQTGTPPVHSAMTLVVDKAGLHDGTGPARPPAEAKALIDANTNIAFARSNKNAIAHGIIVFATRDAPAASVRAAAAAAADAKEPVWLMFRPSNGKAAAPAASAVTKELDAIAQKNVAAFVKVVQREFGACDGLMAMMGRMAGQAESSRLPTLVDAPSAALKKCGCKPAPDVVASILWKLAFHNLGVLVAVPQKSIATLPWGTAKATWADSAPAVVKAVAH